MFRNLISIVRVKYSPEIYWLVPTRTMENIEADKKKKTDLNSKKNYIDKMGDDPRQNFYKSIVL